MELSSGSLTHRFFGIPKVDPPKRALRLSICRFRVPFFDHQKVFFSEKVENPLLVMTCKSVYFTCRKWHQNHTNSPLFVVWRAVTYGLRGLDWEMKGCFAPLPCTVYLVYRKHGFLYYDPVIPLSRTPYLNFQTPYHYLEPLTVISNTFP